VVISYLLQIVESGAAAKKCQKWKT